MRDSKTFFPVSSHSFSLVAHTACYAGYGKLGLALETSAFQNLLSVIYPYQL